MSIGQEHTVKVQQYGFRIHIFAIDTLASKSLLVWMFIWNMDINILTTDLATLLELLNKDQATKTLTVLVEEGKVQPWG